MRALRRATGRPRPAVAVDGRRWLVGLVGGGVASIVLVGLITIAIGTSVAGVVEGVTTEPMRFRDAFVVPLRLPEEALYGAIVTVVVAGVVSARPVVRAGPLGILPAVLRIVAAVLLWGTVTGSSPLPATYLLEGRLAAPVLLGWIAAVPPRAIVESPGVAFARTFTVLLAILEVLQAYPVAGTQLNAAALMFVPVGALMLADGLRGLRSWTDARSAAFTRAAGVVGVAIVAALLVKLTVSGVLDPRQRYARDYAERTSLGVHGAERVRLKAEVATEYQCLVNGIRANCDNFISLPGLNSFYLWTNLRPPTGMNAGNWMLLLDDDQQQRVVDEDVPFAVELRRRFPVNFLRRPKRRPRAPACR